MDECPSNSTGGLLENMTQVLNMVTTADPHELKDGLILLQRQVSLIACCLLASDNKNR